MSISASDDFALIVRLLSAVVFVPTQYVVEAFEICADDILSLELQPIVY